MSVGIAGRVESLDWPRIASDLDAYGCAVARGVLDPEQCHAGSAVQRRRASANKGSQRNNLSCPLIGLLYGSVLERAG